VKYQDCQSVFLGGKRCSLRRNASRVSYCWIGFIGANTQRYYAIQNKIICVVMLRYISLCVYIFTHAYISRGKKKIKNYITHKTCCPERCSIRACIIHKNEYSSQRYKNSSEGHLSDMFWLYHGKKNIHSKNKEIAVTARTSEKYAVCARKH
jgi:hypothetical protein